MDAGALTSIFLNYLVVSFIISCNISIYIYTNYLNILCKGVGVGVIWVESELESKLFGGKNLR